MALLQSKLIVAVVITLHLLLFTEAQDLTAVKCQAFLPTGRHLLSTLYDEDDTVYIMGGYRIPGSVWYKDVFKYSISQDTIEPAGSLPENSVGGTTIMDKHKNVFHFGTSESGNIFQYFPDIKNFTSVASLPSPTPSFVTIKVDEDTALLFGGNNDNRRVLSLNLNSMESTRLPDLPLALAGSRLSVIWVEEKGEAYIFNKNGALGKFNRYSGEFHILPNFFPSDWAASVAVWDGEYGYIVGGSGDAVLPETIIQFDPDTEAVRFIRVKGYPVGNTSEFFFTSVVYVEKLNRIYMFGGVDHSGISISRPEIWYISLDPIRPPTQTPTSPTSTTPIPTSDPEIFNCSGLRDSRIPFPFDCRKFIVCRDNHAYVFDCPEPFLFHAKDLRCTWPDLVDCDK